MAEAVAAFYAVETAIEGAAIGAYAASRPTVPLHVRFRKLQPLPQYSKGVVGHTVNVITGKAYLFGGDVTKDTEPDSHIRIITLPSSLDRIDDIDYQVLEPEPARERPLQPYALTYDNPATTQAVPLSSATTASESSIPTKNEAPQPRSAHFTATIDSDIFVLGGRPARRYDNQQVGDLTEKLSLSSDVNAQLFDLSSIFCFSTQTSQWSTFRANQAACKHGVPPSRTNASCTSTTHPKPSSGVEVTATAHGTIFLHGGYDAEGQALRDMWSFDVSSCIWNRWPDIPDPSPEEVAGEGRIICYNDASLCRVGDGFGKVSFIDFDVVTGNVVKATSGPHHEEVAVKPKSGGWTSVATLGTSSDPAAAEKIMRSEALPVPRRGAGFVPITTGAGRFYNLYFMGQDGPGSVLNDIWSLQASSQDNSAASLKDKVRRVVGKDTGENKWATCEVIESTKADGPLVLPRGMTDFATDVWTDLGGGHVVIWGGRVSDGSLEKSGWLMTVE